MSARSRIPRTLMMFAASDHDANMLYATRFAAPDAFLYLRTARGRRILVMSDLEIDRARATATVDSVLAWSRYASRARSRSRSRPLHVADILVEVLRELKLASVAVPENTSASIVDRLRRLRVRVHVQRDPFFPERSIKTDDEVKEIRRVMRITERGMAVAADMLRRAAVRGGWLYLDGKRLTSESIRHELNAEIFSQGCIPAHTIVAAGKHGCDPHDAGSGSIRAGSPVIVDIFPRAERSGYFGDMTRTFVRGRASEPLRHMHRAVLDAQKLALRSFRHGVRAKDIHEAVQGLFGSRGYETGQRGGRMEGFFHGTGHGVGLDIHEPPRVAASPDVLKKGMVVTVEPGLYYWPIGGVRIEDTVLVTRDGIRNLTRFPKTLELE